MPYPALYGAEKSLVAFPGWANPHAITGYMWFDAPLQINGVVQENFVLHGGCYEEHPERHVTFELRAKAIRANRRAAISRVDWRSLNGTHRNKKRKGWPLSGKLCSPTHHHAFLLNWIDGKRCMRPDDLPQADDFDQEIQSFDTLREEVGKLFRINNIDIVGRPPWVYSLFENG